VFGRDYKALQQNAYCYIHATEVGGTHPALLEAMGFGNCVLTLAAPENIEAIGDAGIPYADESDLAEKLQRVLRDGSLVQAYRNRAQSRVTEKYDWDYVVDRYEELFARMAGQGLTATRHLETDRRRPLPPRSLLADRYRHNLFQLYIGSCADAMSGRCAGHFPSLVQDLVPNLFGENASASLVAGSCNIRYINRLPKFVGRSVAANTASDYSARRFEAGCNVLS
jgi:hypothetical protein